MPLNSVPGQVAAGPIDAFMRDDPADGTLGLPDYSLVPYTYSPLLGAKTSSPSWAIDQYRNARFTALKGSSDGLGVLRSVGSAQGAAGITVIPQTTGTRTPSPDGSRAAQYIWGPRDFAFAVRHSGSTSWTASNVLAYVALMQSSNSIGMRLTTSAALGPWDAELADSASITLPTNVKVWDGNPHTFYLSTFGQNVFCLIDGVLGIPFRAPRAYRRIPPDGTLDASVFSNLPATGSYMGYDCRGDSNYLYQWDALQPASGDFFFYDMGPTTVQTPPTTTYTPTTTASGETWTLSGTVTGSKNGLQISTNGWATFPLAWPYGTLCTRWTGATGALVFRHVDNNNYYQVSSTGVYNNVAGTLTRFHTFTTPLVNGDHLAVRNWANKVQVYVNGVSVASYAVGFHSTGKNVGFRSSSGGSTQWSYIAFQPMVSDPILPAA
jgi:hypothetical protein